MIVLLISKASRISYSVIGSSVKYSTSYRRLIEEVMPYKFIFLEITWINFWMVSSYISQSFDTCSSSNGRPSISIIKIIIKPILPLNIMECESKHSKKTVFPFYTDYTIFYLHKKYEAILQT